MGIGLSHHNIIQCIYKYDNLNCLVYIKATIRNDLAVENKYTECRLYVSH